MKLIINLRPNVENVGKLPQKRLRACDPLELRPPMRMTPPRDQNVDPGDHVGDHTAPNQRRKTKMMMRAPSMFLPRPNRLAGMRRNRLRGRSRKRNRTMPHLPRPRLEGANPSLTNPSPLPREE